MAPRVSFYCAVFLGLWLCADALDCYTQTSCSGAGCTAAVTTDKQQTTCPSVLNACLSITQELTVLNGSKAETTTLSCGDDSALGIGCFGVDDLPDTIAAAYRNLDLDSFEYCLCDQNLCNDKDNDNNGSIKATPTLPIIIGSLLVTLGAFLRQV